MRNRTSRYLPWTMLLLVAAACNGRGPTTPGEGREPLTSPSPGPPAPAPAPSAPRQPEAFQLTGIVTDDAGRALSDVKIVVRFLTSDPPGTHYSEASGVTNGVGVYSIVFSALPGAMKGPAGTDDAVAFAFAAPASCLWPAPPSACAYEGNSRYVLATSQRATQDFRLHPITRITAGESTVVAVAADDSICTNNSQDMHPWPTEFVCRTVRILAPADGTIVVEAVPVEDNGVDAKVQIELVGGSCCEPIDNPASIAVGAGTEVMANVEIQWGLAGTHSFVVKTSMTGR